MEQPGWYLSQTEGRRQGQGSPPAPGSAGAGHISPTAPPVTVARGGGLPIGHGAHLGGALAGAVIYYLYLRATYPTPAIRQPRPPSGAASLTPDEAREFERIRIKIETTGPHTLTPKEQAFLDRLRERVMRASQPNSY